MTCIIVGGGRAGFQAAMTCRMLRPDQAVTLIDAEKETGYYRTLLPQFMVGALPEERLFFPTGNNDPLLTVRTGVRVKTVDCDSRSLTLEGGETLGYDRLILAHGGDPYLPGILAGPPCHGIFPIRDLTNARRAKAWLTDHRQVVVLGGSLVGVKTAVHLRQAGLAVALVVRRGHILLRALSPESTEVIEAHLRGLGIEICVNAPLEEISASGGAIDALKVGGRWLSCNTLLVATGTAPDTSFLEGTGLLTDGKLIVSPGLQTSDPRIFAAGDVAVISSRGEKISPNTWPQAVSQGRLAAENLYRAVPTPHRDMTRINAMDLHGLAMVILGPPVSGAEVISHARADAFVRRELFLVAGRAVGGALIGDITAAGTIHALINSQRQLTAREAGLIRPRTENVIRFPEQTGRRAALILSPKRSSL
ncbi:MAG: NAD(P)/FAD-dependent oxidoreductase [Syntrophobacterales bacterium]|nr:NAD(P)/FAD-dependent oxidoreductase [Syntrophobacterales bacterium]